MATKHTRSVQPGKPGPQEHPKWAKWITEDAGVKWELYGDSHKQGKKKADYTSSDVSMREMLYRKARNLGYKVSVYQREVGHLTLVCHGRFEGKRDSGRPKSQ